MREFNERKIAAGICPTCGGAHDRVPLTQCSACAARQAAALKLRRADRKANGFCTKCHRGTEAFGRGLCFRCWCCSTAQNTLGKWDRGPELVALWHQQDGHCALTGTPLDATAELDHIHPQARGGSHEITNLRWVQPWVNMMKLDATDKEFAGRINKLSAFAERSIFYDSTPVAS